MQEDILQVVLGVIDIDSKLLMIKRRKPEDNLVWSFPGGKVEQGETKENACIREVYEETGLNVVIKETLGVRNHPDNNIELTYYLCDYVNGEIKISNYHEVSGIELKDKKKFERDVGNNVFEPVKQYIEKNIK